MRRALGWLRNTGAAIQIVTNVTATSSPPLYVLVGGRGYCFMQPDCTRWRWCGQRSEAPNASSCNGLRTADMLDSGTRSKERYLWRVCKCGRQWERRLNYRTGALLIS